MHGAHIDLLSVYVNRVSGGSAISPSQMRWGRRGTQGNYWNYAQIPITPTSDYQVREATTQFSYH